MKLYIIMKKENIEPAVSVCSDEPENCQKFRTNTLEFQQTEPSRKLGLNKASS